MQKNNPLVSVIIPVYNEAKNIERCLKSLFDQTYPEIETVVVDDGSSDGSVAIISKFPVTLISGQHHNGPAKARNKGVEASKGEVLVFLDADMTFSKQFIEDLVRPVIEGSYKGTFSKEEYISNWTNPWSRCWNMNNGQPARKRIPENFPDEGNDFRAILRGEFIKVGGFDDTGYTDTWTLVQKLGYRPHSVEKAVYYHSNPDNLSEVFRQAKWVAKRKYKFGLFGWIYTLFKSMLPFSLTIGLLKSLRYSEKDFILFKVVYDFAYLLGLLEMIFFGKLSK